MPLSVADTAALRARLQRERHPQGGEDSDAEEEVLHHKRVQYEDAVPDESDGGSASASGGESSDSEAADAAAAAAHSDEDPIDAEELAAAEAELIAQVKAERRATAESKAAAREAKREAARQAHEHKLAIQFAKNLAHNEKKVRDRAVRSLRKWMLQKETLDEADLMKICKGLFYCFWMSDKVPVQQQLAQDLSDLMLPPLPFERALLMFRAFLLTMQREWTAIDQLRMDKFMSLARRFVHKAFMTLQASQWGTEQVEAFTDLLLESGALDPSTQSRGFFFHMTDVFLPELERASTTEPAVTFPALYTLLTPFFFVLARATDETLVNRVKKEVFDELRTLARAPLPEADAEPPQRKGRKRKAHPDEEPQDDEEEEGPSVALPVLHAVVHGNADKIAELMRELAADPDILPRSRKLLYSYRADFDAAHLAAQAEPDESDAEEAAPEPEPAPKPRKRKAAPSAEDVEALVPGLGAESLAQEKKERSKKKNKRQRLADKRRKKEAILAESMVAAPSRPNAAQSGDADEQGASDQDEEGSADFGDEDLDMEDAEFDGDAYGEDVDMDGADMDGELEELEGEYEDIPVPDLEAEEDDTPMLSLKQSKKEAARITAGLAAKKAKAASKPKNRQTPFVPDGPPAGEELPPQPKAKKQKTAHGETAPAAAAPAPPASKAKASPQHQSQSQPAPKSQPKSQHPGPRVIPDPEAQPNTPPKASPRLGGLQAPAQTSQAFSTPPAVKAPAPAQGRKAPATAGPAPSSGKKVKISLGHNQVRSFKRWSRDSVSQPTPALLAKPTPPSALKKESLEIYMRTNKNGIELAKRQQKLALELAAAAGNGSAPTNKASGKKQKPSVHIPSSSGKTTPPVSPNRAKAADYFFH